MKRSVFVGYDAREAAAYHVAVRSLLMNIGHGRDTRVHVETLLLSHLKSEGLFTRPQEMRGNVTWDLISDAPCATEFSISRFLIGELAKEGWALFMDCDMLVRADINELFDMCDPSKALMCVQHDHVPTNNTKMDGQMQTAYPRKNWSSVFCLNLSHPANKKLTVELVNSVPGRDLHRFCWLQDDEIGSLPIEWNWLAGHSSPDIEPKIVHHTDGSPCMPGYENTAFAEEWRLILASLHSGGAA